MSRHARAVKVKTLNIYLVIERVRIFVSQPGVTFVLQAAVDRVCGVKFRREDFALSWAAPIQIRWLPASRRRFSKGGQASNRKYSRSTNRLDMVPLMSNFLIDHLRAMKT